MIPLLLDNKGTCVIKINHPYTESVKYKKLTFAPKVTKGGLYAR